MRLVLLGPPGVGKGTQAVRLAEHYAVPHISTGDMFRQAVSGETPMGLKVKQFLDAGELVPDEVTTAVLSERIESDDCGPGFILDGFPRTLPQAEALDGLMGARGEALDAVLSYTAPEETVVERLSGRRMCRQCGANFHRKFSPPDTEGVCSTCGGELYQRSDDRPDTIRDRLRVYAENAEPLVDHYRQAGLLVEVAADGAPDEVAAATLAALAAGGEDA